MMTVDYKEVYRRLKAEDNYKVLFFKIGDFWECFEEDAIRVAEILNLTLTSKQFGGERLKVVGFPNYIADNYMQKLIITYAAESSPYRLYLVDENGLPL